MYGRLFLKPIGMVRMHRLTNHRIQIVRRSIIQKIYCSLWHDIHSKFSGRLELNWKCKIRIESKSQSRFSILDHMPTEYPNRLQFRFFASWIRRRRWFQIHTDIKQQVFAILSRCAVPLSIDRVSSGQETRSIRRSIVDECGNACARKKKELMSYQFALFGQSLTLINADIDCCVVRSFSLSPILEYSFIAAQIIYAVGFKAQMSPFHWFCCTSRSIVMGETTLKDPINDTLVPMSCRK